MILLLLVLKYYMFRSGVSPTEGWGALYEPAVCPTTRAQRKFGFGIQLGFGFIAAWYLIAAFVYRAAFVFRHGNLKHGKMKFVKAGVAALRPRQLHP